MNKSLYLIVLSSFVLFTLGCEAPEAGAEYPCELYATIRASEDFPAVQHGTFCDDYDCESVHIEKGAFHGTLSVSFPFSPTPDEFVSTASSNTFLEIDGKRFYAQVTTDPVGNCHAHYDLD